MQSKSFYKKDAGVHFLKNCAVALVCLGAVLFFSSCKKFVEADAPKTSLSQSILFDDDASAISALTGLYQQFNQENLFTGYQSLSLMAGLSADEFTLSEAVSNTDNKYYYY